MIAAEAAKRQREAAEELAATHRQIAHLTRQHARLTALLATKREAKQRVSERVSDLEARTRRETAETERLHVQSRELELTAAEEAARLEELRVQLAQAAAQNKRQLAATLRGVQLLRASDGGPDPKLLSMSQLHMLGEVLSALFERLHTRDDEAGAREDALCTLLDTNGIPLPTPVTAGPRSPHTNGTDDEAMQRLRSPQGSASSPLSAPSSEPGSQPGSAGGGVGGMVRAACGEGGEP